jgi:hypothetical protein
MLNIASTVVRDGLRKLLPALSSFQPFPSEMFGGFARCFKLIRPAPFGDAGFFLACGAEPAMDFAAPPERRPEAG